MDDLRAKIQPEHDKLKNALRALLAGSATRAETKHETAPLGIYPQRNGLFMMRVRVPGGHTTPETLAGLARTAERNAVTRLHLTTRQDVQLHDVTPERVGGIVDECTDLGLPFRGGGGNTFRNIAASPESGVSEDSVFDVYPHVRHLNQLLLRYDKAFELPRKLKISFSCSAKDTSLATVQDLGFVACVQDGHRGFRTYGGGGMGRQSAEGIELFAFLPETAVGRCALAMTDLFHEHGERTDRNRARIRFIVDRLGPNAFRELFLRYFAETRPEPDPATMETVRIAQFCRRQPGPDTAPQRAEDAEAFAAWRARATRETVLQDMWSAMLFVPRGDLSPEALQQVADLLDALSCTAVRLTRDQNLFVPALPRTTLAALHRGLTQLPGPDLLGSSLQGQLVTCVGAKVCAIGVLDSAGIGQAAAQALDELLARVPSKRDCLTRQLLESIRISGCPNSCANHRVAALGLQGQRRRIGDELVDVCPVFLGGTRDQTQRHLPGPTHAVRAEDVPAFLRYVVRGFLEAGEDDPSWRFQDYLADAETVAAIGRCPYVLA